MSWGTPPTSSVAQLRDLFVHRDDVYALQRETGAYYVVNAPVTDEVLGKHLRGEHTVGLYQLATDNTVKWVCFDLDTEEPEAREHLCYCVITLLDPLVGDHYTSEQSYLVEDSNGQGRTHVWLFLSEPLPAEQVRSWLARDFWPLWWSREDGWSTTLEVFPKQDWLEPGGYGNLVRLPLGVNRKNGKKSRLVVHQGWSESVGTNRKLDSSLVPRYEGRASALLPGRSQSGRVVGDNPTARLQRGEVRDGERNNTFARAAWALRKQGLDKDLAREQLHRWNDGLPEPLDPHELDRTIDGAFRKETTIEPNDYSAPRPPKEDLHHVP